MDTTNPLGGQDTSPGPLLLFCPSCVPGWLPAGCGPWPLVKLLKVEGQGGMRTHSDLTLASASHPMSVVTAQPGAEQGLLEWSHP